jgi:two-component system, response regulator
MRNLLLIEDNPDDIYLLTEAFQDLLPDASLKVTKHGDEAIDYLSGNGVYSNRRTYPLPLQVILDLGLPYRSGLEVLEWIRSSRDHAALSVIVLSGTLRQEDIDKSFALGIDGFFRKPVDYHKLAAFIREPQGRKASAVGGRLR